MFNFLALLDIRVFGRLPLWLASDWPRTFFTPKVFLFSILLTKTVDLFSKLSVKMINNKIIYLVATIQLNLNLTLTCVPSVLV